MKKRNTWFWNVLIGFTLIVCILVFVLHYQNWTRFEGENFHVISGVYRQKIPLAVINKVKFVDRIPELERKNGFSWLAREKGIFLDSLSGNKVYIFVDDLKQRKIELTHHDSLLLYRNLADSTKTQQLFGQLLAGHTSNLK